MHLGSVARNFSSLQTNAIEHFPVAAEVQTAAWENDVDLGREQAVPASIHQLKRKKINIDAAAFSAYLRLDLDPDTEPLQELSATTAEASAESAQCVCCGMASRIDEVGFCAACVKAAEPDCV